jgi:hypothetical protein
MVSLKRSAEHGSFKSAVAPTRCAGSSIHIVIAVERSQFDLAAAEQSKKQQQHRVWLGRRRGTLPASGRENLGGVVQAQGMELTFHTSAPDAAPWAPA